MTTDTRNIEQALVLKIIQSDQSAFEDLYNLYADKLYYFALRYLKTKEEAENIIQDVFVKIWETRDRLNSEYSISAYLFTIARNTIFNLHRKRLNETAYLEYLETYLDSLHSKLEQEIVYSDLNSHINKIVDKLPMQRKKVFELSRNGGLSHKEISQQLNISEKTIETHIRLAIKDIRKILSNDL